MKNPKALVICWKLRGQLHSQNLFTQKGLGDFIDHKNTAPKAVFYFTAVGSASREGQVGNLFLGERQSSPERSAFTFAGGCLEVPWTFPVRGRKSHVGAGEEQDSSCCCLWGQKCISSAFCSSCRYLGLLPGVLGRLHRYFQWWEGCTGIFSRGKVAQVFSLLESSRDEVSFLSNTHCCVHLMLCRWLCSALLVSSSPKPSLVLLAATS